MGLKERLMNDFKEAMKTRDEVSKNTINLARAAIKQYEVDNRKELDDEGVISILQKQGKMRKDALAVLKKYIPEQLSKEEILKIVEETAAKLGIDKGKQNMGKLMGPVMGTVKGKADGSDVREVVMNYLSE